MHCWSISAFYPNNSSRSTRYEQIISESMNKIAKSSRLQHTFNRVAWRRTEVIVNYCDKFLVRSDTTQIFFLNWRGCCGNKINPRLLIFQLTRSNVSFWLSLIYLNFIFIKTFLRSRVVQQIIFFWFPETPASFQYVSPCRFNFTSEYLDRYSKYSIKPRCHHFNFANLHQIIQLVAVRKIMGANWRNLSRAELSIQSIAIGTKDLAVPNFPCRLLFTSEITYPQALTFKVFESFVLLFFGAPKPQQ